MNLNKSSHSNKNSSYKKKKIGIEKYTQPSLSHSMFKEPPKEFGGSLLKNSNPKIARPITTKNAMHIVLRSSIAVQKWSFMYYKNKKRVEDVIRKQASEFNIKIYQLAINTNHIHLLIKLNQRETYAKFIKAVCGIIAKIILGRENAGTNGIKFWDNRPYSRIVEWIKDFLGVKEYVIQNRKEAAGVIPYKERKSRYTKKKYKLADSP